MSTNDRELEALLRRALQEHAQKVVPVGDGLAKIQQRAANRRRRLVWLRPSIAVAAAAVAVVAAIAIPTAIHRMNNGNSGTDTASRPSTSSATTDHTTSAKPGPTIGQKSRAVGRLSQVTMSWPYSSRIAAAKSDNPALQSPDKLARTFVASFTGPDSGDLVASGLGTQGGAPTVKVRRDGMLVSTVQLAKIGSTAKPTYVVTGADGTNVSLSTTALRRTSNSITVGGTFTPDARATAIWAGAATTYDAPKSTPVLESTTTDQTWQLTLNPPSGTVASGPKILAAWTVDINGKLRDFTAIAAN